MPELSLPGWRVALCTWFGAGLLRPAPGTWGSLAAALPALGLLLVLPEGPARWLLLGGVAVLTLAGAWCAPAAIARFQTADPPQVVVDEAAGTWLAIALLPGAVLSAQPVLGVALAVLLFRVFDIAKPWPVGWCEHLPGGWGIMADDLAAGALAGCLATALLG